MYGSCEYQTVSKAGIFVTTKLVSTNIPATTRLTMAQVPEMTLVAYKATRTMAITIRIVRSIKPMFFFIPVFFWASNGSSRAIYVTKITYPTDINLLMPKSTKPDQQRSYDQEVST